jgi:hypothetical protein
VEELESDRVGMASFLSRHLPACCDIDWEIPTGPIAKKTNAAEMPLGLVAATLQARLWVVALS